MEEIWKDIKNYEGLYQVSNYGKIKSLDKCVNFYSGYAKKICKRKYSSKVIKPSIKKGYLVVGLNKNGKCKYYSVHRLVAMELKKVFQKLQKNLVLVIMH